MVGKFRLYCLAKKTQLLLNADHLKIVKYKSINILQKLYFECSENFKLKSKYLLLHQWMEYVWKFLYTLYFLYLKVSYV